MSATSFTMVPDCSGAFAGAAARLRGYLLYLFIEGGLPHDPAAVLSELPRARVVSHRRRVGAAWRWSSIRSATSSNTWRSPSSTGLRIAHVILTHFHADFIAGHLELRDRRGRADLSRRRREGGIRLHAARPTAIGSSSATSACRRSRRRATRPSRSRSRSTISIDQRYGAPRGADRRHAVRRRRRPARSARRAWLGGGRSRRAALRLAADTSCSRCPTRAWSIRRTAPARCAARRSARRRSRPSASSAALNYALQPMTKAAFVDLVTADQPDAPRVLHLRCGV